MTTMNKPEQIMKLRPLKELLDSLIETHEVILHRGSEGSTTVTSIQVDTKDNRLILSDKIEGRKLSPSAVIIPTPCFISINNDTMTIHRVSENLKYKVSLKSKEL